MARTPRALARRRAAAPVAVEGARVIRQAICPVCGMFRAATYRGKNGEKKEGWNLGLEDHQHFGAILTTAGPGTLTVVGYFGPEDDPEGFHPRVKKQLLEGLEAWLRRGWVAASDVQEAVGRAGLPPVPAVPTVPVRPPPPLPAPAPRRPRPRRPRVTPESLKAEANAFLPEIQRLARTVQEHRPDLPGLDILAKRMGDHYDRVLEALDRASGGERAELGHLQETLERSGGYFAELDRALEVEDWDEAIHALALLSDCCRWRLRAA